MKFWMSTILVKIKKNLLGKGATGHPGCATLNAKKERNMGSRKLRRLIAKRQGRAWLLGEWRANWQTWKVSSPLSCKLNSSG